MKWRNSKKKIRENERSLKVEVLLRYKNILESKL